MTDPGFDRLFELVGDPAVVFELRDGDPIVRQVNSAFEGVFGYDGAAISGEPLNAYIVPPSRTEEAKRFDRRTSAGKQNSGLVIRETADGRREFFYRGLAYDRGDDHMGLAIYTDVTDQRRYERHLRVIHRLFRHDLRNSLQVILSAAELVRSSDPSPQASRAAETIIDHAHQLETLGEEVRAVEEVLLEESEYVRTNVAALCRSVVAEHREDHPEATFDVAGPDRLEVTAIEWLREALAALVENAAVHAGSTPTVRLSAYEEGTEAVVRVADDGPGIPRQFRAPVFEGRDITQFQHNRGIGLWLVRWVVEQCGGYLDYEREDGWTVIELRLSLAETDEPQATPIQRSA